MPPDHEPAPDPFDPRELARRAAAGDSAAFEALFARYDAGLQRFLLKRCGGDGGVAEELSGAAWVEVWRALEAQKYDPRRSAFSTFLYAVGFNVWRRFARQARAAPALVTIEDDLLTRFATGRGAATDTLALAELIDALRICLGAAENPGCLDSEERTLVDLLGAGESERQIALRLNIAASTVNARKKSAFQKLRRCLASHGFFEAERRPEKGE